MTEHRGRERTPEQDAKRKSTTRIAAAIAAMMLAGWGVYHFYPQSKAQAPAAIIPNDKNVNPFDSIAPKEVEKPKSRGDVVLIPPEIDMGSVTVGQDHYTGSFTIKIADAQGEIEKIDFPFAQQTGLKIDASSCPPGTILAVNEACPVSFIFDPLYFGRVDTQATIRVKLTLSNGATRVQSSILRIIGDAAKPAPPPTPVPATVAQTPTDDTGISNDAVAFLARRQKPGGLDRQFDETSYTYETDQKPIQDDWKSLGYGSNLSSMPVDMSRVVTMDKPIPAVVKLPIDSRRSSRAVATVERDIYGGDGRLVVIERGSTLIGTASSVSNPSEEKVMIVWERLMRPDGSAWRFQGLSGDAMGRSGIIGLIDQRWIERFGTTLAVSAITASLNIALNASQSTTNAASGTTTTTQSPTYLAMQQFQGDFRSIFSEFAKEQLSIPPIISVPVGTRITVFPTTDLWLRPERPTDDMRAGYARTAHSSDAYRQAAAKAADAAKADELAKNQSHAAQTAGQPSNPYAQAAAQGAGALPRSGAPLTPVAGDPSLAPDSYTGATSTGGTLNDTSATNTLRNSATVVNPSPGGYMSNPFGAGAATGVGAAAIQQPAIQSTPAAGWTPSASAPQ